MLPTIGVVVDGKTKEFIKGRQFTRPNKMYIHWLYLVGFDELGGTDEFSTEMLEWRLGCAAVINYTGNILEPPDQQSDKKQVSFHSKKTIRDSAMDSSDSD